MEQQELMDKCPYNAETFALLATNQLQQLFASGGIREECDLIWLFYLRTFLQLQYSTNMLHLFPNQVKIVDHLTGFFLSRNQLITQDHLDALTQPVKEAMQNGNLKLLNSHLKQKGYKDLREETKDAVIKNADRFNTINSPQTMASLFFTKGVKPGNFETPQG